MSPNSFANVISTTSLRYFSLTSSDWIGGVRVDVVTQPIDRTTQGGALITEVEKGKYILLGLEPEQVLSNPIFIASHSGCPGVRLALVSPPLLRIHPAGPPHHLCGDHEEETAGDVSRLPVLAEKSIRPSA
jgi:hypothetical protein